MTAHDLRRLADRMLKSAQECLEQDGGLHPIFALEVPDQQEIQLIEIKGKMLDLMESGAGKDILFGALREWVQLRHATACVIVTEAWVGQSTAKGVQAGKAEIDRLWNEGGWDAVLAAGVMTKAQVINITAQDENTVFHLTQPFERDEQLQLITFGPLQVAQAPQAQFQGRSKMYGDLDEGNLFLHKNSGLGKRERHR